ncbi:probable 28S ribosomal protein S26, mitochondrial [Diabrotica virgifera virgifera]|uniref:Small ribosomal subunit protein mS26 n=1 Tax=Diabrotica virgifera virgifera TaxID=50390 RepID=A0A6P7FR26_DIAVI|nr:probable 28S ribosomal protein S26, mitochondrial [Diabrotica virgifera virgifera]
MYRLTNICSSTLSELTNYTKYETVRYLRKRKPIHLGTAKSKLFRIPKRPVLPPDEKLELMRLFNNYRTTMKSLRYYFMVNHSAEFAEVSEDPEESRKVFLEDFQKCSEINAKWNEKQKELREKDIANQHEAELTYVMQRLELEKKKQQVKMEEIEEIVKAEKVASKDFITAENLDEAIERALATPVDYNFALTPSGEKILGRDTIPNKEKETVSVKQ